MQSFSTYTDQSGKEWHIPQLISSNLPRIQKEVSVIVVLNPILHEQRWGLEAGNLEDVLTLAKELEITPCQVRRGDTLLDHARCTCSMIFALSKGWEPEPIIIGLDGTVWDGLHRLIAFSLIGRITIEAIDFSCPSSNSKSNVLRS
jgi:hypothetical protein